MFIYLLLYGNRREKEKFIMDIYELKAIRKSIKTEIDVIKNTWDKNQVKHLYLLYANLVDVDSIILMTVEHLRNYEKKTYFHDIDILKKSIKSYKEISRRNNLISELNDL